MSNKRLSSWCQSILPANYRQIKYQTQKYQQFMQEQLPDSVRHAIQVVNVSTEEIVIAVSTATMTNYLRLHIRELQQQIHETFNTRQKLVFKTMPESLLQIEQRPVIRKPDQVSRESIESIASNAQWVEDENLKKALQSLARQLKDNAGN